MELVAQLENIPYFPRLLTLAYTLTLASTYTPEWYRNLSLVSLVTTRSHSERRIKNKAP
jgi:hypothetical protein